MGRPADPGEWLDLVEEGTLAEVGTAKVVREALTGEHCWMGWTWTRGRHVVVGCSGF
jgi:hypothetical protein